VNQEGRDILYRVNTRCAEQWGIALARMQELDAPPGLCSQPFEAIAWHDAIYICTALRNGLPVADKFRKRG